MKKLLTNPAFQVGAVLILLSLLTLVLPLSLSRVTQIAIMTLYVAGTAVLISYLGLLPFGASLFFGLAGYVTAISLLRWFSGANELVGLVLALAFSVALAIPVGLLILRRAGLYFALLTIACTQISYEIVFKWTSVTGGENGLQNVPRPMLASNFAFHVFTLVTVVAVLSAIWKVVHSPLGRLFQALRDNEQRTISLGYSVFPVKLAGFVISAAVTGLAGGMMTLFLRGVYPSPLSLEHAPEPVLMLVLGGIHHVLGALWGAATFIVLQDQLSAIIGRWWLIFAPILMVVALTAPEGLHGVLRRIMRLKGRTLVRPGIPPRPVRIEPFRPPTLQGDAGGELLLTVRGLTKSFGKLVVASGYDFNVHAGTLHSFIGPNGAGKTTFFNMLTGLIPVDAGTVQFLGKDITHLPMHKRSRLGLGRSFQIVSVFTNLTAFENVRLAVQAHRPGAYAFWRDAYLDDMANMEVWSILDAIGLADKAAEVCTDLSHGERRLLEIGITLATDARLLLLDEPLAGLAEADRTRVSALIKLLARSHGVVLIEHDIDRVLTMSDRITVLHQGKLIADGKPAEVAASPEVISAYLGAPPEVRAPHEAIARPEAAPVGEMLLEASGIVSGYGGGRVIDGAGLTVRVGEAVGLLGRNGVGKTTLLRTLYGQLPLDAGIIRWKGQDIQSFRAFEINRLGLSIVPEGRRLFPNLTVTDNLRIAMRPGGMSLEEVFELFPRLQRVPHSRAENLSGGERQMVAIARALVAPTQLILMDEPFEGLAPTVVSEVTNALVALRGRVAMVLVEHHVEQVLSIVERAVVLVNGRVAWEGSATDLAEDLALQARLLGIVEVAETEIAPAASEVVQHR